ncbi:MAG: nucleotidyltransferase domain-containing protein [Candidatus Bipolaricaulia bacterium]
MAALESFLRRVEDQLHPVALILFGSLAKGDYHQHSDADVCVILDTPHVDFFAGYERVAHLDAAGIVQPIVFGAEQFLKQIAHANTLALEICHDGIVLRGRDDFLYQVALRFARIQQRYAKTATGWIRIHRESQRSSSECRRL